jgi:hypothetical protein
MSTVTYNSSDKKEEDLMDVACDTYGGEEKCMQGLSGMLKKRGRLEYLSVDEIIVLKYISQKLDGRV